MMSHFQFEDCRSSLDAIIDNYADEESSIHHASDAPEIDTATLAPQFRGESDPPEVSKTHVRC